MWVDAGLRLLEQPFCLFCLGGLPQLGSGHLGSDRLMSGRPKGGKRAGNGSSLTAGRAVSSPAGGPEGQAAQAETGGSCACACAGLGRWIPPSPELNKVLH